MEKERRNGPLVLSGLLMSVGLFSLALGSRLLPQMILLSTLGFFITNKRYLWFDVLFKTIRRDLTAAKRFLKVNLVIWWWERNQQTIVKLFQKRCQKHPDKIVFRYEDDAWTYRQLDDFSNRVGNYFKREGYKKGDAVALYMENRIEYVAVWLGLSKIGVVTALINSNLKDKPFLHSIAAAESKALVYSRELKSVDEIFPWNAPQIGYYITGVEAVKDSLSQLNDVKLYEFGKTDDDVPSVDLKEMLSTAPETSLSKYYERFTPRDKLLFIYTSGTTGLPKAAVINNMRYIFMSYGVHVMLAIAEDDVLYDPLPLYHTSGGIIGIGQALMTGNTVAIRKKFSASNFWPDCIKYECTVACYIGEICRYLLAVPSKSQDTQHKVRLMYGNGLRPQIWKRFVNRFRIKQIGEFYGSTEGNSNLVNIDNKIGAVGFVPRIATAIYPVALVKVNQETEEPIRNARGFCIQCKPGEPGMFVGKINHNKAINSFTGYADRKASEKKILKNVFSEGDRYFNSGDVLVMDEYGYFYFKDRTGDTFRWKGENVATSEVEAVISNIVGLKDAIVYGVEVPHAEGRAGMAAILDTNDTLDLKRLDEGLKQTLPGYARPLFVRILTRVPLTGTYKLKKKDLQIESFNPNVVKDKLYFYDIRTKQFEPITMELYNEIQSGAVGV